MGALSCTEKVSRLVQTSMYRKHGPAPVLFSF